MENLFAHDSLQRVEPAAKLLSEQQQKNAGEVPGAVQNQIEESEEKEIQSEESQSKADVENEEEAEQKQHQLLKRNSIKKEEPPPVPKNKFMGGQLFDADA